ncbi:hypothetical protein SLA2020_439840 [Shorea laevis]
MVPAVLKQPLSPSTYKHYFAALLYAEDFYLEKWSDFQLKNVILELHEAEIKKRSNKYKDYNGSVEKDDKSLWYLRLILSLRSGLSFYQGTWSMHDLRVKKSSRFRV